MTLGERLRTRRQEHELTVAEVATLAGVDVVQVRAYEAGWTLPQPKTLERLAAVLSLPVDELLDLRLVEASVRR